MKLPPEKICVVIGRTRHKMVQIELMEAAKRGAQLIELRLDFLSKAPDLKRLLANRPCPYIATVRRPNDGGRWAGTEEERTMLLRQTIVGGFDWVDLETDVADNIKRFKDVKRIVSYHNMKQVPEDLEKIHEAMCNQDPDVVKIAVTAQNPADNLRVLKLIEKSPKPTIAFCMGEFGIASRLLATRFGAPFTYAAFNKERGIAPGIFSYEDLKNVYRVHRVGPDTAIFGLIGDPVAHSLSPLVQNRIFESLGIDAMYVPFRVPRMHLENCIKLFDQLPVSGYSVTIPHKESALRFATMTDPAVNQARALNTLIKNESGFTAYNTDYQAAREALIANLPPSPDGSPASLASRTVLIVGAGGAARAVAHALFREGSLLTITNRTNQKGLQLAEEVGCRSVDWEARHSVLVDIVINCTPVGMFPNMDESPLHPSFLKPGLTVMDVIYSPEQTMLIKEARSRGCHVITGVDMFVRQAALQFELFTGQQPPLDSISQVVRSALSPVSMEEDV